jgi:putative hemolysin
VSGVLIVTLVIVAWLTASASAVRSVSRIWLRHWVEQRLRGAGAAEMYLERPHRMLLAASTGVSLTVFAAGLLVGSSGEPGWETVSTLFVYSLSMLIGAQLVPRAVARRWPTVLIPILLPPVRALDVVLTPLLGVVRRLTGERGASDDRTREEEADALQELLREGEIEGVGERAEIAIINSVVQFGERRLADVMTPRSDVFALDASIPADEVARRVAQSGFSRVPLYAGDLDHIVGMIHAFDILKHAGNGEAPALRPVATARASAGCNDQLIRMLRERRHLSVVTDDAGRTLGIVTLEDLLEELVGEITDAHDEPAGESKPGGAP